MPNAIQARSFEELYNIHHVEYNVGFMNITDIKPREVDSYLEENFDKIPRMFKCIIEKASFDETLAQLDELYYVLDDCIEKIALINYIKTLTSHFADVSDSPLLGLSMEKVNSDMCRSFHCDMNHLRLVYPLLGPGTLWLNETNVRREYLGKNKNDLVVIDQTKVHQVPPNTITLLKGQGHPSANGLAVVHASPNYSEKKEKRILLRIESMF